MNLGAMMNLSSIGDTTRDQQTAQQSVPETPRQVRVPNVIRTQSDQGDSDDNEEFKDPTPQMQEHIIHTQTNRYQPNLIRMRPQDLSFMLRSKRDLYQILQIEAQYHLPTYDMCTLEFLRQCLVGQKKLLKMAQLKPVKVPRLKEFSAQQLYDMALQDPEVVQYIPDQPIKRKQTTVDKNEPPCSRGFLFNVINTIREGYFTEQIKLALKTRKEKLELSKDKTIAIESEMFELIRNSQHISKESRGKQLTFRNTQSNKRSTQAFLADNPNSQQMQMQQRVNHTAYNMTATPNNVSINNTNFQELFKKFA